MNRELEDQLIEAGKVFAARDWSRTEIKKLNDEIEQNNYDVEQARLKIDSKPKYYIPVLIVAILIIINGIMTLAPGILMLLSGIVLGTVVIIFGIIGGVLFIPLILLAVLGFVVFLLLGGI